MPGVAILANSTWAAISARRKLKVTWDESTASKDSWSKARRAKRRSSPSRPGPDSLRNTGDVDAAFAKREDRRSVLHLSVRLARAAGAAELHGVLQGRRGGNLGADADAGRGHRPGGRACSAFRPTRVTLHQTRVGGGFGRRLMNDYMCEAAAISKQAGVPVKLQWTREDDMQHDFYRVGGFHSFKGGVDEPASWSRGRITSSRSARTARSRPAAATSSPDEFPALLVPNVRLTQTKLPLADSDRPVARAALELDRVRGPVVPARMRGRGEARSSASSCSR